MHLLKTAVILIAATALAGCSSDITAWKNRSVASHKLIPGRFFTMTGERRMAFFAEHYDPQHPPAPWWDKVNKRWVSRMAWCAESLPEVAQAVTTSSKPKIDVTGKATIGTEDAYATSLTQTFTRTEIAEMYRQMAWNACQAWAQGIYTDAQYAAKLDKLIDSGIKVIEVRATQPLVPAAKPEEKATSKDDKKADNAAAKCKRTPNAPACKKHKAVS